MTIILDRTAAPENPASGGFDAFFKPRSVAVVGASVEKARVGGRVLAVLDMCGFSGAVYPVNPKEQQVQERQCYPDIASLPVAPDLAIICLGAARIPEAIRDCGKRGIKAAVVFADGFEGALKDDLLAALDEARAASGLRMIGPNTVGIRALETKLFATFAADIGTGSVTGNVATVAQSGGLGVYFGSAQLMRRGVGASYVLDTGGEFDIDAADCVDQLADDAATDAIALVLEGARDGRRLAAAVRKATGNGKSVCFLKTGKSMRGVEQIASHTGALAGKAALFENAMRDAGAAVCRDELELLDAMVIASFKRIPRGRRIGVVTPSGGFGILVLDAAEESRLEIPTPEIAPTEQERQQLVHGYFGNPLDYSSTISAGPRAVETSIAWMAGQPNIDAVILWQAYGAVREDRQQALLDIFSVVLPATDKPIFVCGVTTPDFEEKLRGLGVLWFEEPTRLIRALGAVAPAAKPSLEPPRPAPMPAPSASVLSGQSARDALGGLPGLVHVASHVVTSAAQAHARQQALGTRIILKVESEGLAHKSEAGFVTGPLGADAIEEGFAQLDAARQRAGTPDAPIILQPFEQGVELALGAFRDPTFGPAVMVATGGIFLEILKDAALALAPLDRNRAIELIGSLRGAPLLNGARGKPLADIEAAADALVALSQFIADNPLFEQIDINPLIVRERGRGAIAVDAVLFHREEK